MFSDVNLYYASEHDKLMLSRHLWEKTGVAKHQKDDNIDND
jgi:hypothetical protein